MKRLSILLFPLVFFSINALATSKDYHYPRAVYCPDKIKCQGTVCTYDKSIFSNIVYYKKSYDIKEDYLFTHAERSRTSANGIPANVAYCDYELDGEVMIGIYTYKGITPWYNYFTNSWAMGEIKGYGKCTPTGYGNPADTKACPWND